MKYYIIPMGLAERLSLTGFRTGDAEHGYIVNSSDLVTIGIDEAKIWGAKEITAWEAKKVIENINNK